MNQIRDFFNQNGYVVLTNAIEAKLCQQLTQHMFTLHQEGKTTRDAQCPLSDAVYSDPVFEDLLRQLAEPIGRHIGKKLLPTYTYSRIYRHGEVLKKHKDRPACEISATLTLGFDAKPIWPIFMDEKKQKGVTLDVGDMVVYRGCDILHWRDKFIGQWHVQVFFHYVDAEGPYRDHENDSYVKFRKMDNNQNPGQITQERTQAQAQVQEKPVEKTGVLQLGNDPAFQDFLNPKPEQREIIQRPIFNAVALPNNDVYFPGYMCYDRNQGREFIFTKEECEKIIALTKTVYPMPASVGGTADNSGVNKEVRSAMIYELVNDLENRWIYEKVMTAVAFANKRHFDYEISGLWGHLQLIHYSLRENEPPGHYSWHIDAGTGDPCTRKISFTAQLSDPDSYQGCDLIVNNHGFEVKSTREQGSIHMFPSYMPHIVTPIAQGERYALVIWVHGARRFR